MDVFIEHMVKRKKSVLDAIMAFIIIAIGLCLLYFATYLVVWPALMLLAAAGIIYATYKFVMRINMEYEYIITNGELDVEKIINRRTRKHVETVNIRLLEDFAPGGTEKESRYLGDRSIKKIIVCESVKSGYYYMTYTQDNRKKILFFTPNDEIIAHIRKVNPGKF